MAAQKRLFYLFFLVRLVLTSIASLAQYAWFRFSNYIKRHKTSSFIYLIIAIELLVLLGQVGAFSIFLKNSLSPRNHQAIVREKLSLNGVKCYSVALTTEEVAQEEKKIDAWLKAQPNHRDLLINYNLLIALNKSSRNNSLETKQVHQAKKLDPNWLGFK